MAKTIRKSALQKTPAETHKLDAYLAEMALDEELILSNLIYDPVIAYKQLRQKNFSVADFQGLEANRILLGVILALLDSGAALNPANLLDRLVNEKQSGNFKIDLVGGRDRIHKLFSSPFSSAGVTLLEDLDPVVDRIRDRNIRNYAKKLLIQHSEKLDRCSEDAFETLSACMQDLRKLFLAKSAGYIRNMDAHVSEMRELIQENNNRRSGYLGYNTNFPILQERLSGFQKEFYLITGGVGMGKSTFVTQLAWDLTALNPELAVIYFSLDLNRIDVTAKFIAQSSQVPIDYVKNPYVANSNFEERRQNGLAKVAEMRERLFLVDESSGRIFLDDIKRLVKRTKLEWGRDVAVIIDPIFKIHLKNERMTFNEKCNYLSAELKSISATEGVTLIATAGLPKAISRRRPIREDLEEIMGFLYDPYVVFFLYCDYVNDFETPFLEWQWGNENFLIPITEAFVAKNKMGGINTRIFFRYFESYSFLRECAPQEVENYTAMIENLQKFKEDKRNRESAAGRDSFKNAREEEF